MTRRSPQVRRVPGGRFRPSLGYEPYDVRLPCPGQSPAAALASADLGMKSSQAICVSLVSACPAASRAQMRAQISLPGHSGTSR